MPRFPPRISLCALMVLSGSAWAALPLTFEPNQGQLDPRISFLARTDHYVLALTNEGLRFQFPDAPPAVLQLVHASLRPESPHGENRAVGQLNYFLGRDPSGWHTHVPTYERVRWPGVYPGVDLILRGSADQLPGHLEIDFEVAPGSRSAPIEWSVSRGATLRHRADGALVLKSGKHELVLQPPRSHEQDAAGHQVALASAYRMRGPDRVGFTVEGRHRDRALVIDPVLLDASYLDGSSSESVGTVRVDASQNIILAGSTSSTNFPVTNGSALKGSFDAFVTKLDPTGHTLLFSSFIGGTNTEQGGALAVAPDNSLVLGGFTQSIDFPVHAALQTTLKGSSDGYIIRLSADGATVIFATYLGGSSIENVAGVATDSGGNIYVGGATSSTDFPIAHAVQATFGGASQDVFVTKLDPTGSTLLYSTYLGGSDVESCSGIRVTPDGHLFSFGGTASSNFPVHNAFQSTWGGTEDGYVTALDPSGAFVYSTYWGATSFESIYAATVSPTGSLLVTGFAQAPDFPSKAPISAYDPTGPNVILGELSRTGSLIRSAFLVQGLGRDLVADSQGGVYVVGSNTSGTVATQSPIQQTFAGGTYDGLLMHVTAAGNIDFASYLGGSDNDTIQSASLSGGKLYFTGGTNSTDFAVTAGAYQSTASTTNGSFFGVLEVAPVLSAIAPPTGPDTGGASVTLTGSLFEVGDTVTFDGVLADNVQRLDAGKITAVTPAHASGVVDVAVHRGSVASTLSGAFTYVHPPRPNLRVGWNCESGGGGLSWSLIGLAGFAWVTAQLRRALKDRARANPAG